MNGTAQSRPDRVAQKRRQRRWLLGAALLTAGAGGAMLTAERSARWIETRTTLAVSAALRDGGYDWATPQADGLRIRLSGTAPDEVARVRAVAVAARVTGSQRIIDALDIAASGTASDGTGTLPVPPVQIELLRNGSVLSVAGTLPEGGDRQAILDRLARAIPGIAITDLLQPTTAPAPDDWDAALSYALGAIALTSQAKLSLTPGHLTFAAIADGDGEKARLTTALNRDRPARVALDARIDAPRPVIAPFILRATRTDSTTRIEACSASDTAMAERLALAASPLAVDCRLGLGLPGPDWPGVAEAGLRALNTLTGGTLALVDRELTVSAPAGVDGAVFDAAMSNLRTSLPPGYRLNASRAAPKADAQAAPSGFTARFTDGRVELAGRVASTPMRDALGGLAAARLGPVDDALSVDPDLPADWTARQIALIEAMGGLADGEGHITPSLIRLSGISGDPQAGDIAVARLSHRLGAGYRYSVRIDYDPARDSTKAPPSAASCVDRLNDAITDPGIAFAANSTDIPPEAQPMLAKVAAILGECGMWRLEIGGHTDSQGRDALNLQLSQGRAVAVRLALADDGAPVGHVTARGWGDTRPRADNATDEGRAANRRIEFTVTDPAPVALPVRTGPALEGETRDNVAAPATAPTQRLPTLPAAVHSATPDTSPAPPDGDNSTAPQADGAALAESSTTATVPPPPARPDGLVPAPDTSSDHQGAATGTTGDDADGAALPAQNWPALPSHPSGAGRGPKMPAPPSGFGAGIAGSVPPLFLDQIDGSNLPVDGAGRSGTAAPPAPSSAPAPARSTLPAPAPPSTD